MPNPRNITKILAIRTDRFGEFILTLPALHALKKKFPESRLTLMLNSYNVLLVEGSPDIDEIIRYDEKKINGFWGTVRLLDEIRKRNFDTVVIFNPQKKFNIVSFLAGIPFRVGYDRKWGFLLNKKIRDLKFLGNKHEVEYNFDLVKLIGADSQELVFPIVDLRLESDFAQKVLLKAGLTDKAAFIAIHPWASNPLKEWPFSSFISLAKKLIDELELEVIIIGGPESQGPAAQFEKELGGRILNLTGRTNLKELTVILSRVRLLITNDSGPMHLAACLKIPVVALFRKAPLAVSARRWGPLGEANIVVENDNIKDIAINEVFDAIKKILQR